MGRHDIAIVIFCGMVREMIVRHNMSRLVCALQTGDKAKRFRCQTFYEKNAAGGGLRGIGSGKQAHNLLIEVRSHQTALA